MTYSIDYIEEEDGIVINYYGIVTDEDMQNSVNDRAKILNKIPVFRYAICDCTDIERFEVSSNEIRRNANQTIELGKKFQGAIIVIIAPTKLQYGLWQMWQIYAEDGNWKSYIAHSREQAREWLNHQLLESC